MPTPIRAGLLALGLLAWGASALSAQTTPAMAGMDMGAAAQSHATVADWAKGAQAFDGLAKIHRPVTTASAEAQRYFDQGMALMWGFNHDEATRSFARAAELDPGCAACFWGVALTVGPNYNLPFLTAERAKVAREALLRAQALAAKASPEEQALIAALAHRYPDDRPLDGAALLAVLTDYADAMRSVAAKFPDDLDVQTLYAESLMNLHAWKLWAADGTPAPGTLEIVATLESVMARDPGHVGANHYYIHAMEASPHPEKAVPAAERLASAAPAEGHLVHMPAHVLERVGRYEDAAQANRLAVVADQAYQRLTTPPDYYAMYVGHNYQFLAYSAAMEGRRAESLAAADQSRAVSPDSLLLQMPGADWYVAEIYLARVRFGRWDELLAMQPPDARLPGMTGGYLYGRAMAQAATGDVAGARASLAKLRTLTEGLAPDAGAGQNTLKDVLAIALAMVEARIAGAEHRSADQIAWLRKAVAAEDAIAYDEPSNWLAPTRHALGAALLAAGDAKGAVEAYREDLVKNPGNGWALRGLAAALSAQGRTADAATARAILARAWRFADVTPAGSEF